MGRIGITYLQVAEAADAILAGGDNPTIEKVRRMLGDTGSNSHISQLLREWKRERLQGKPSGIVHKELVLPDPLSKAVADIWLKVKEESNQWAEKLAEEARSSIQLAQKEKEAALSRASTLEESHQAISLKLNHTQTDYTLLQKEFGKAKKQGQILQERVDRLNENYQRIQHLHQITVKDLNESAAQREQKLEAEVIQLREELEKQRHAYIAEIDALKVAKSKAEQQVIRIEAELIKQKETYTLLEEAKKKLDIELIILLPKVEKYKQEVNSKDKTIIEKDKLIIELQAKNQQQEKYHVELKEKNTVLEQKFEKHTEQIGELKTQIAVLKNHRTTKTHANGKR